MSNQEELRPLKKYDWKKEYSIVAEQLQSAFKRETELKAIAQENKELYESKQRTCQIQAESIAARDARIYDLETKLQELMETNKNLAKANEGFRDNYNQILGELKGKDGVVEMLKSMLPFSNGAAQ